MSLNDPLANALSHILNSEQRAKGIAHLKPSSRLLKTVLDIMKGIGYIGEYKEIDDGKGKIIELQLLGKINKAGVIKPRFAIKSGQFERYEKRYLPAKGFGVLMVSTNQGVMSHDEAKKKNLGGKLIAYCY